MISFELGLDIIFNEFLDLRIKVFIEIVGHLSRYEFILLFGLQGFIQFIAQFKNLIHGG